MSSCPSTKMQKVDAVWNKQENGCTEGKKCSEFHPKMCPASMTKGKCMDKKCNFMHVRGTRASKDSEKKEETEQTNSAEKSASLTKESFLEMIHLLRKELREVVMNQTTQIPLQHLPQQMGPQILSNPYQQRPFQAALPQTLSEPQVDLQKWLHRPSQQ